MSEADAAVYKDSNIKLPKPRTDAFMTTRSSDQDNMSHDKDFEYNIDSTRPGTCIIFNNVEFDREKERKGSDEDMKSLEDTFSKLGFNVISKRNATCEEMYSTVELEAENSQADCFVCVILSHGETKTFRDPDNRDKVIQGDVVHGTDSYMKFGHLTELVSDKECPNLKGKPRIFINNTCRSDIDKGAKAAEPVTYKIKKSPSITAMEPPLTELDMTGQEETDAIKCNSNMRQIYNEINCVVHDVPIRKDFMLVCSTSPGFVSFRSVTGSYFIQSLCQQLSKLHKTTDLNTILTRVNYMVSHHYECKSGNPEFHTKKQMPSIASKLTKLVYFR